MTSLDIYDKPINWEDPDFRNRFEGLKVSQYDAEHLSLIIHSNMGDWMSAHLFRFLYVALPKADEEYMSRFVISFPNHCRVLLIHRGWKEEDVRKLFSSIIK